MAGMRKSAPEKERRSTSTSRVHAVSKALNRLSIKHYAEDGSQFPAGRDFGMDITVPAGKL